MYLVLSISFWFGNAKLFFPGCSWVRKIKILLYLLNGGFMVQVGFLKGLWRRRWVGRMEGKDVSSWGREWWCGWPEQMKGIKVLPTRINEKPEKEILKTLWICASSAFCLSTKPVFHWCLHCSWVFGWALTLRNHCVLSTLYKWFACSNDGKHSSLLMQIWTTCSQFRTILPAF